MCNQRDYILSNISRHWAESKTIPAGRAHSEKFVDLPRFIAYAHVTDERKQPGYSKYRRPHQTTRIHIGRDVYPLVLDNFHDE